MAKKQSRIDALLDELLKDEDPKELFNKNGLIEDLTKRLVERALEGEMTDHLGYQKNERRKKNAGNARNGKTKKSVVTNHGSIDIEVPRDRDGDFEPQLIRKRQRRLPGFDEKVIALYARGMTVREIQGHLKELYSVEVSPTLISNVTDSVIDDVRQWQARPLDTVYPIVYLDAIHLKIRKGSHVENRAVYLALGVNLEGNKELLGLWVGEAEGAKFWLGVLTELQNRGVKDILVACVDGLNGFPEAIENVFPKTQVQLCIVHMVRNSLKYVGWKERKNVVKSLKEIYTSPTEEAGLRALDQFEQEWGDKFPIIAQIWRSKWGNILPFFSYPEPIRKVIYTTNAIESLNSSLKKITKKRAAFPTEDSVRKVLYLAILKASEKWSRPIRDWAAALNYFSIVFEGRVPL